MSDQFNNQNRGNRVPGQGASNPRPSREYDMFPEQTLAAEREASPVNRQQQAPPPRQYYVAGQGAQAPQQAAPRQTMPQQPPQRMPQQAAPRQVMPQQAAPRQTMPQQPQQKMPQQQNRAAAPAQQAGAQQMPADRRAQRAAQEQETYQTRLASKAEPQTGRQAGGVNGKRPPAGAKAAGANGAPPARNGGNAAKAGSGSGGGRPPKGTGEKSTTKIIIANILKVCFALACVVVVVGCVVVIGLTNYLVDATANDQDILDLENLRTELSSNSQIYVLNPDNPNAAEEKDYILSRELSGDSNSMWVELKDVPTYLTDALVATEDRDFWTNEKGFYIGRTVYAGVNEVLGLKSSFGASTLDQQLVKNITGENEVVGEDGDRTAGYERKIREIFRAYRLNKEYSKDMIMEAYLNTMPLSGNLVGVQSGAKRYFNKEAKDLTVWEAATIAGITQKPGAYDPFKNPDACKGRRDDVLTFMYQTGKIDKATYDNAVQQPLGLNEGDENSSGQAVNSYFEDALLEAVVEDMINTYDISRAIAIQKYYSSGLQIYSTMDVKLQTEMETQYEKGIGNLADGYIFPDTIYRDVEKEQDDGTTTTVREYPESAMAVIDYNGALKGVVGGIGEKTASLVQNRAVDSQRQVGSTMKPIGAYALAIDYNYTYYSQLVQDSFKEALSPYQTAEDGTPILNWPKNAGQSKPPDTGVLVVDAVARSLNTVAVDMGQRVTPQVMYEFMTDTLQIESLDVRDIDLSPMVLGSLTHGMTPYELAGAFQMFGNGGVFNSLHCYTEIRDANGMLYLQPEITSVQAIDPETAYIMNRMLSTVLRGSRGTQTRATGTGNGMAPAGEMDSVAKTGTTDNHTDRWIVGLTPYYVSAVWWGFDYAIEGVKNPISSYAYVGAPPQIMWKTVMENVQADMPVISFAAKPEGVEEKTFCRATGELAGPNCTDTQTGYYRVGGMQPGECWLHSDGVIVPEEVPAA
ncbi:MAG: transglycosylase domain-containing protein [Oscillospiraceae bacterium]